MCECSPSSIPLAGFVGEEVLNPCVGLASDAIETQFKQETLVWDLVKGL